MSNHLRKSVLAYTSNGQQSLYELQEPVSGNIFEDGRDIQERLLLFVDLRLNTWPSGVMMQDLLATI
jgi:hypothetical protein